MGLIGESYYNIDFNKFFYLTDTGRRWDGWKTSVRNKVPQQKEWEQEGLVFHRTQDIIKAAKQGKLPDKIMITFHPQRWNDSTISPRARLQRVWRICNLTIYHYFPLYLYFQTLQSIQTSERYYFAILLCHWYYIHLKLYFTLLHQFS